MLYLFAVSIGFVCGMFAGVSRDGARERDRRAAYQNFWMDELQKARDVHAGVRLTRVK